MICSTLGLNKATKILFLIKEKIIRLYKREKALKTDVFKAFLRFILRGSKSMIHSSWNCSTVHKSDGKENHGEDNAEHKHIVAKRQITVFLRQYFSQKIQIARHGTVLKIGVFYHFHHTPLKIIKFHIIKITKE